MCELTQGELAIECGHLRHEIEYLQKLVADIRAAKEQSEKERDGLTGLLSKYSQDVDRFQSQAKGLEAKSQEIEEEHGQELRAMRSFAMDLEIRLEAAQKATEQETKRANNAALRAERNALRLAAVHKAIKPFVRAWAWSLALKGDEEIVERFPNALTGQDIVLTVEDYRRLIVACTPEIRPENEEAALAKLIADEFILARKAQRD